MANTILPELQELAEAAEARAKQTVSDDPFANLPPAEGGPTPEQIAAAAAAALAVANESNARELERV